MAAPYGASVVAHITFGVATQSSHGSTEGLWLGIDAEISKEYTVAVKD
ncbi:hypothetical protein [Pontibacter saemangeumensis]